MIKSLLGLFIGFCLVVSSVAYSQDGLDENSFGRSDEGLTDDRNDTSDESVNDDRAYSEENFENNEESNPQPQNTLQNSNNIQSMQQSRPVKPKAKPVTNSQTQSSDLDKAALPENSNTASPDEILDPAQLSDNIKNLATPLTSEDYFPAFIYDDRGRKDPFTPRLKVREKVVGTTQDDITEQEAKVREGLAKFEISSLTLTAILIGKQSRPKALIKDPAGSVYIIHENDIVGRNNGVVRKIRQGQVVIVEYRDKEGERLYTTQVLSLGK